MGRAKRPHMKGVGKTLFPPAMDTAATKLLEAATIKTLHAANFARASSQSALVLTDLLARYLALLSETSAKHAHHAGRTALTAHDALAALAEMGVAIDELAEYGAVEARELNRYAQHSARRTEDLNEFKGVPSPFPHPLLLSSSISSPPRCRSAPGPRRRDCPRVSAI